ncbi:regulatory protein RecX [Pilimelia anulata]
MAGRRYGARRGRGWDAAPPPPAPSSSADQPPRPGGPTAAPGDPGDRQSDPGDRQSNPADGQGDPAAGEGIRHRGRSGGRRRDERPSVERDPFEFARDVCLRQLATRPRTRTELAAALRRRGVPDEVAGAVLERYAEVGMIDDAAFARAWVTSRHHGRGLARRALVQELRHKGVTGSDAEEALAELDPATEAATARELVRRKLRGMARVEYAVALRRLGGMLARKGYPAGLALSVVREELAARGAADDDPDGGFDAADAEWSTPEWT